MTGNSEWSQCQQPKNTKRSKWHDAAYWAAVNGLIAGNPAQTAGQDEQGADAAARYVRAERTTL